MPFVWAHKSCSVWRTSTSTSSAKGVSSSSFFDFVFTSGVLIHISPDDISSVLDEMYRCTRKYIWSFEYYAKEYTPINYHGHKNLLWKTDFSKLFLSRFGDLELVKEEHFKYAQNDNVDTMFLIQKKQ